jgi:hypothetical protein
MGMGLLPGSGFLSSAAAVSTSFSGFASSVSLKKEFRSASERPKRVLNLPR